MKRLESIRNFCIIAHIDHGKSTLADRLLEITNTVSMRDTAAQQLDSMDIEKERGITIKATAARMVYHHKDGNEYVLNLIDTPGHVDFTYEVSRAMAACEGALLVVDASQGIEAQTIANTYLALDNNLEIIPVLNKVDLQSADVESACTEIEDLIGLDTSYAPKISAKTGLNVNDVLDVIIDHIPAPTGDEDAPLQAMIFDSTYDSYKGAISFVRIKEGQVKAGDTIQMMSTKKSFEVVEVGKFMPNMVPCEKLMCGDVGFIAASIKNVVDTRVGDTITLATNPAKAPLAGYKKVNPMVYCGIYPADGSKYDDLKDALERLQLNDASINYEPETSVALGFGFRCGFLGLLHMEIIQERIEREFDLDIITTAPSVAFRVIKTDDEEIIVANPTSLPDMSIIRDLLEPMVKAQIMVPNEFVGDIMDICVDKRGIYRDMRYMENNRVSLSYDLPLVEIIYDFFDILKSRTKGYASFDYELSEYKKSDLVKLDIMLNGEVCDALSLIVHRDKAYNRGRIIAQKLKDVIPRQQFEIPIQATIGSKIIARETVKALRKDVLAKCYGGDISRKKKLLEKQKKGKKRMRQIGSVEVPSEAFMTVLKMD